jgi:hypothetical protein
MKKENKLAVYEKALELYKAVEDPLFIGFCYILTKAILILEYDYDTDTPMYDTENYDEVYDHVQSSLRKENNEMLELAQYKPDESSLFWFPTETKENRIEILEEVINFLKNE